ncbi:MAG: ATP-binding cassette domain-containing protein [Bacteroidetes bacterium]|nr:ATP-binding cassette domain-containing protein [Bacteroidota bacterium]
MLKLDTISSSIGSKKLLNQISVSFFPGKINLIIGPNGSGKSTLIKAMSKQIPYDGNIFYEEVNLQNISLRHLSKFRAVLSQHTEIAFPLKVWEVVMMGRYPHFTTSPGKQDEQAVREAMHYFEINLLADRDYSTLSGGEKQRVNFARVLAQIWFSTPGRCRYLFLDEPLTFLDVNFQYQFMAKLQLFEQKNDLVIVGVVHDLNLASKFGDSILLLNEGKVASFGKPEEVLTEENIERSFKIKPSIFQHEGAVIISF